TRRSGPLAVALASALLTVGVMAHHFIAIGAAEVVSGPALAGVSSSETGQSVAPHLLAIGVAGATLAILGMSLVALVADRRLRRLYRKQNHRLDVALNNMSHGLCMFDATARLMVCNQRYLGMYDLPPSHVKPGCTLYDLLVHRIARGNFSGDPAQY